MGCKPSQISSHLTFIYHYVKLKILIISNDTRKIVRTPSLNLLIGPSYN